MAGLSFNPDFLFQGFYNRFLRRNLSWVCIVGGYFLPQIVFKHNKLYIYLYIDIK